MSGSTSTTPRIAIIGAGPASLTLAAILKKNSIPFTIFEASETIRHQGGTLDIHPATGQVALKEAGLWDEFVKHARPESDVLKLVDVPSGEVIWDENTMEKPEAPESETDKFAGRPEIDRAALMKITHGSLDPESVKWGKKLKEVVTSTTDEKKYDLRFADDTKEEGFDLVIGGDGAWSKVRGLLSSTKPHYSGISAMEVWHNDVENNEWLVNYVGAGSTFAFGEGIAMMAQRQGDGSLRSYACLRVPEDFMETCGINWSNKDAARKEYVERYFHVAPELQRVVLESKDHLVTRALYELPVDFKWESRSGVTLIGDAAHVMTPFAGVGVNVGMTDSLVLAKEIISACKGEKSLDEALQAYEKEMFPRAEKYARKTAHGKENHFVEGGSKALADRMKEHFAAAGFVHPS